MSRRLTLVLGGARSGKSHHAEQLALQCVGPVTYVATAGEDDEEMQLRVALHRARRPANWALVEEPMHLAEALYTHAQHGGCVLVDCMTLWLNNLLFSEHHEYPETGLVTPPEAWTAEIDALLTALPLLPGEVILVSNEIGLGVVPMGREVRAYVDALGRINQRLAAVCARVTLVAAGLPLALKGSL